MPFIQTQENVTSASTEAVVRLALDFGYLELTPNECGELVRRLRERERRAGGKPASVAADRLDLLLVPRATEAPAETELDAIADAAWEWVERAGPDAVPERILLLLDVLRSRHAHE